MNRITIPVISILIVAVGIGGYLVLPKSVFSQESLLKQEELEKIRETVKKLQELIKEKRAEGKDVSKAVDFDQKSQKAMREGKTDECLRLLKQAIALLKEDKLQPAEQPLPSCNEKYKDSPFGIFGPYEPLLDSSTCALISKSEINNYLKDIKVSWIQEMPRGNNLDEAAKSGVNIYSRALPIFNTPPRITEEYKMRLKKTIKQYKDRIKYWEVDTEPSGLPSGWHNHPEEYAEFLKITYEVIKSECPDCKVVFGGLPGVRTGLNENSDSVQFLKSVLDAGGTKYFDVFEFKQHHYNANDYPELRNKMGVYGKMLSQYGINIKKIPVFIETAMYDGDPDNTIIDPTGKLLPPQTEIQQASALIKIYVYGLAQGIDKIFWNLVIENGAGPNTAKGVFQHYGLVQNPDNDGFYHKKLAYYTYKKMTEFLEGSDWNNIQTIQEADGIYIYKFTKNNKPIWVVWNDNSQEKQITISGISSSQVNTSTALTIKITEAVPKYETGKDVTNYNTAFNTETKTIEAEASKITLTLKNKPMFVEGK